MCSSLARGDDDLAHRREGKDSELPRVPYIEGDISLLPPVETLDGLRGIGAEELEGIVNTTVMAELANGSTYILAEAWCRSALELNSREGQCRVRFEGVECIERMGLPSNAPGAFPAAPAA
jgi:Phage tail tube protein